MEPSCEPLNPSAGHGNSMVTAGTQGWPLKPSGGHWNSQDGLTTFSWLPAELAGCPSAQHFFFFFFFFNFIIIINKTTISTKILAK
jgi:hypothetical protein